MWISENVSKALNEQIGQEFQASAHYLAIAGYFESETLPVIAARFFTQSEEERTHAIRLIHYLLDSGAPLSIPAIPAYSQTDYSSALDAAISALEAEKLVTKSILALVNLCATEGDHLTVNFLQWFVSEQREEMSNAEALVKIIERAGDGNLFQVEAYLKTGPQTTLRRMELKQPPKTLGSLLTITFKREPICDKFSPLAATFP